MNGTIEESNNLRKKLIFKVSAVFLCIMVLLTFFSNTINNFSLPRVKAEQPSGGSLSSTVTAEGGVREKETAKLYCRSSREAVDILVKAGSRVKKGDMILRLDKSKLEEKLKEESISLGKMRISLERLRNARESMESPAKASGQPELDSAKWEIDTAKETLVRAEKDLASSKALYESGAVSRESYEKAQGDYDKAKKDYENKIETFEAKKTNTELDIRDKQYDLELQQMKVDGIKKELESESEIHAPCDGIIKEIGVGKGSMTQPGTALCSVINVSKGFEFCADVTVKEAAVLDIKDPVSIALKLTKNTTLEGQLTEIRNSSDTGGNKKELVISIPQEGLSGGEPGSIRINKQTRSYDMLVPNSAVGQDSKGKFVYILKERKGVLGNEYYIQRASITVDDSDSLKSAVSSGIGSNENIVVYSSKDALTDGCRVMPER